MADTEKAVKRTSYVGPVYAQPVEEYFDKDMKYTNSVIRDLQKIAKLLKMGHEIVWSPTNNWCEIGGKTFNINKEVFEKRIDDFLV